MRYGREMDLLAYDDNRVGIPLYSNTSYEAQPDELISLIPQPSVTLTTRGLVWELTNEALTLGVREGGRNRSSQTHVDLEVHDGAVFLFVDARLPLLPEAVQKPILHDES